VQAEHGDLVIASVYVPNGGKDYPAKLAFVKSLIEWAAQADGRWQTADSVRRHQHRACRDGRASEERKPNAVDSARRSVRCSKRCSAHSSWTWAGNSIRQSELVHVVGAVAQSARTHIGWRLDYVLGSPALAARATSCVVQAMSDE